MTPTQPRQKFTDASLYSRSSQYRYVCDISIVYDVPYVYTMTDFGDNHTALVIKKVGVK